MTARSPRVLAVIQAGGQGSRMDVLTRETPKPALPFAGSFRLIDFPLSNLRNSGISDVWLSVQYLAQDLADVVANGKPWDLDRHRGGFRLIMPQQGSGSPAEEGFVSGNAEELLQNRDAIRRFGADAVVVMSADHVYRIDYLEVVAEHLERAAECTVVTTEVSLDDASHHAVIETDDEHRVTGIAYKPESPRTGIVATEVFVYSPEPLIEVLESLHRELSSTESEDEDGNALGDFGEHLVPALIRRERTYAYRLPGYWRDLGRPETYVAAHRELLSGDADLFADDWPVISNNIQHLPVRLEADARVSRSLISPGCDVRGEVRNSVLGPGVTVGDGARVSDSILFADVRVESGAQVAWSVIADGSCVGRNARVGGPPADPDGDLAAPDLTLVGRGSTIGDGVRIPRGGRLEPGTTA